MARHLSPLELYPFVLFMAPPDELPEMWVEGLQNPGERILLALQWKKGDTDPFCDAVLELMIRERGGYPDRHDPIRFKVWSRRGLVSQVATGCACVVGTGTRGGEKGITVQFHIDGQTQVVVSRWGQAIIPPLNASHPFKWAVLDDEGFERLMYRLFCARTDEFQDVQWLQKTRAADSGRDISAVRRSTGARVLIQARHQQASLADTDISDVVVKAETWEPRFDEVIIVTTSAFTQGAVRWTELHNIRHLNRPRVSLEPHGHLEVLLSSHPQLIAHTGLRS